MLRNDTKTNAYQTDLNVRLALASVLLENGLEIQTVRPIPELWNENPHLKKRLLCTFKFEKDVYTFLLLSALK